MHLYLPLFFLTTFIYAAIVCLIVRVTQLDRGGGGWLWVVVKLQQKITKFPPLLEER